MPMPMSSVGRPSAAHWLFSRASSLEHRQRRLDRVIGVIGIVERRREERHDHVADELVHGALVGEHDRHHRGEVLIELPDDRFGLAAFGDRREPADVGEENRHVPARAAQTRVDRARQQLIVDVLRDVAREEPRDAPLLAALDEVLVGDAAERGQRGRCHGLDERHPLAPTERRRQSEDEARSERRGRTRRRPRVRPQR